MVLSKIEQKIIYGKFRYIDLRREPHISGFPNNENKNAPYLFDNERNNYPDEKGIKFYYPNGYNLVIKRSGQRKIHTDGFRYYRRNWFLQNEWKTITYCFQDHRGLNILKCVVTGEGKDPPKTYSNGDEFPEGRSFITLETI